MFQFIENSYKKFYLNFEKILKFIKIFALIISIITFFFICFYVLLFVKLSFDGALHYQAAINLIKKGKPILDNFEHLFLAIGLPFQVIASLIFLLFGKSLITANIPNILFYFFLFVFTMILSKRSKSILPLLAFIATSFNFGFMLFGFAGYGEMPALVIAIIGGYLFILINIIKNLLFYRVY